MSAVRLARAATRRDRLIKFAGCYHGHVDALLASAGSGVMTLGIPSTPGVPTGVAADTIVCPFNDVDGVAAAVRALRRGARGDPRRAGRREHGLRPARARLPRGAADARATRRGALLVFDEVITGFRVARGGAQERYGVTPDLTILGKIVGGGLPAAAFGGRAELMERLAPVGDVYQAGTLSGNPLATAAGISVLRRLRDPAVYEELERRGARLEAGPRAVRRRAARRGDADALLPGRRRARLRRRGRSDTERYAALFRHLLASGIYVPPSQFECMFVSLAHGDEEIDGRSRPLATSSRDAAASTDAAARSRRRAAREPALGATRSARGRAPGRAGLLARSSRARGSRSASRRSTRATSSTTAGRGSSPRGRRHGAAARRLPLRARARAGRGDRQRRGGARSRRADLALRPGACRRARRRGRRLGRDVRAPRAGRARRCARGAPRRRRSGAARAARARGRGRRRGRARRLLRTSRGS